MNKTKRGRSAATKKTKKKGRESYGESGTYRNNKTDSFVCTIASSERNRERENEREKFKFVPERQAGKKKNIKSQSVHGCLSLCLDVFGSYIIFFFFTHELFFINIFFLL